MECKWSDQIEKVHGKIHKLIFHLRLSASAGSIPGRLMVMADGAPTSYVLIGLEQILNFISQLKTKFDAVDMGALK